VTLRVANMTESMRFYRDVLGMEILYGGEDAGFSSLRAKDAQSAIFNLEQGEVVTVWGRLILHVTDVDALRTLRRAKSRLTLASGLGLRAWMMCSFVSIVLNTRPALILFINRTYVARGEWGTVGRHKTQRTQFVTVKIRMRLRPQKKGGLSPPCVRNGADGPYFFISSFFVSLPFSILTSMM
jgi:hypothetical protein